MSRRPLGPLVFLLLLCASIPAGAQAVSPAPSRGLFASGISEALARRRAATISQIRYDLDLDLNARDSAVGRVRVRFRRSGKGDLALDFRGRRLGEVRVNGTPLVNPATRADHLVLPARLLRLGGNTVELGFVTDIAAAGASIIRTHDATDGSDYLYTLLVPADAHQLFPCFDQPDLKARVRLALTAPADWSVVANGPAETADTAPARDRVTTRFAPTRPISTYLIAFAAGPWRRVRSTEHGRTITAYVRRSRAGEADLDTLLALNHRALDWMERWYGRAYPFDKFDFVLAPAFPFGGMEHPGAVFYSEDSFIFRERPTLPRRLGRYATVLHEVAHQWFGDLVTMRWFDDLWLKEGFATFMAAKALADLEPDAGAWKTFYLGIKPPAYAVDQTAGTRPLWQALANLNQAKSNYGPIVYDKAPAVLKQLEHLVGEPAFQRGVRSFLARFAYGNADWRQLLDAIARTAGHPLDEFGREFMLRPGMPVVEQRLEVRDGRITRLDLTQRPAVGACGSGAGHATSTAGMLEHQCLPAASARPPLWHERTEVLLSFRDRAPIRIPVELRGPVTGVPAARGLPAPELVFANADDYGYFLLLLDSTTVATLENGGLARTTDPFLRAMLWGSLWDQVRAFRMAPERFVSLALGELPREGDEQIAPFVLARLERAVTAYLGPAARARLQTALEDTLWGKANDRTATYGVRKASLNSFIALADTPAGLARLDTLLAADSAAGEPLRDPTRWNAVERLLQLGTPEADARLSAQSRRDSTPDGRRRAFVAGAARPSAEVKRSYFSRYFADSTLNEEWASSSLEAFNSLEQQALTFPFLRPALDSLPFIQANRRIFFLESWLAAFLRGQTNDSAVAVVEQFLAAHPRLPLDLRRKVLQHGDELERTVRIRHQRAAGT